MSTNRQFFGLQHLSTVLVREVLCACQAISGQHIKVPPGDEDEPSVSTALNIPLPERQLMLKMSELGWLFRCAVSCHAQSWILLQSIGLVPFFNMVLPAMWVLGICFRLLA